jgi:hypothetical protein
METSGGAERRKAMQPYLDQGYNTSSAYYFGVTRAEQRMPLSQVQARAVAQTAASKPKPAKQVARPKRATAGERDPGRGSTWLKIRTRLCDDRRRRSA